MTKISPFNNAVTSPKFFTTPNYKQELQASTDDSSITSKTLPPFKTPSTEKETPEQIKNDKALIEELAYLPTLEAIGGGRTFSYPRKN
jgi:hypothetical protein